MAIEQRPRERHHLRALVVGRAGLQDTSRGPSGDDDVPAEARADDERDVPGFEGTLGKENKYSNNFSAFATTLTRTTGTTS